MIFLDALSPQDVAQHWPDISATLRPAVMQDSTQTMQGVYDRLIAGLDQILSVEGDANGYVVFEVTEEPSLWTKYVAGSIDGGVKHRLQTVRDMAAHIENAARGAGCKFHNICGRDWSAMLPDYESVDNGPNGLRKELN